MKRIFSITAASVFVLFFITIVVIADHGRGDRWWGFIHGIPAGDKLGHFGLAGALSLLCNLAFTSKRIPFPPRFLTVTTLVLFTLITAEELTQAFLPHRTCDPFDWLADLAGLTLGQFIADRLSGRRAAATYSTRADRED